MAFTILDGGSFTSTGVGVKIPVPSSADYFHTWNMTQLPLAPATGVVVEAEWFGPKFGAGQSAANDGIRWKKTNSTNAINKDFFSTSTASNGFTYVTTFPFVEGANTSGLTATAANPSVVTQTNTYSAGDFVRLYNTTGDLTLGGMVFQISSVSGSGYTLLGLPATAANGFTALTAGTTRRVSSAAVEPEFLYITNISRATQAIVSTTIDPSPFYAVGMKVHFSVPSSFGMKEIDQLTGTITALNAAATTNTAAYNVVVDIDTSAFTAFTFPASALSPTAPLFATLAPAGAKTTFNSTTLVYTGYDFGKQPFRSGQFIPYMYLAGGAQSPAGASGDVINWIVYKLES